MFLNGIKYICLNDKAKIEHLNILCTLIFYKDRFDMDELKDLAHHIVLNDLHGFREILGCNFRTFYGKLETEYFAARQNYDKLSFLSKLYYGLE